MDPVRATNATTMDRDHRVPVAAGSREVRLGGWLSLVLALLLWTAAASIAVTTLLEVGQDPFEDDTWAGDLLLKIFLVPAATGLTLLAFLMLRPAPDRRGRTTLVVLLLLPLALGIAAQAWKLVTFDDGATELLGLPGFRWQALTWLLGGLVTAAIACDIAIRAVLDPGRILLITGAGLIAWTWSMVPVWMLDPRVPMDRLGVAGIYAPATLLGLLCLGVSFFLSRRRSSAGQ